MEQAQVPFLQGRTTGPSVNTSGLSLSVLAVPRLQEGQEWPSPCTACKGQQVLSTECAPCRAFKEDRGRHVQGFGEGGLQRGKALAGFCVQTLGECVLSGWTHLTRAPTVLGYAALEQKLLLCTEKLLPAPAPTPERCTLPARAQGLEQSGGW